MSRGETCIWCQEGRCLLSLPLLVVGDERLSTAVSVILGLLRWKPPQPNGCEVKKKAVKNGVCL